MSLRRLHDLTPATLHELPSPCRSCMFWETPDAPPGGGGDPGTGLLAKEAWWQATSLEWGAPGKAVYVDDHLVGFAVLAPRAHVPRARRLGPAASDDALLLATLWVDPAYRGDGLAKTLLQGTLRETARHGARALEVYGSRRNTVPGAVPAARAGGCVLPEPFLLAMGFTVHHEHHAFPLLRLDLRQTARWAETLEQALTGVRDRVRIRVRARVPLPVPTPAASPPRLPAGPGPAGH